MAGRSYQISNSPARTPSDNSIEDEKIEEQLKEKEPSIIHNMFLDDFDDDFDDEDPFDDETDTPVGTKFPIMLGLIGVVIGIGLLLYYFALAPLLDITHGAAQSDIVVNAVASSIDDFSYGNIETYVPKALRDYGFISDSDAFARFRELDVENDYKLKKIVIEDTQTYTDIPELEEGLVDVYKRKVDISEANSASLKLDFADGDGKPFEIDCNMITIKVGFRWYLYTGSTVDVNGEPFEFIVLPDDMLSVDTSTDLSETEISYRRAMSAAEATSEELAAEEAAGLDFYEDAAKDLASGQCVIDGVVHTMPDAFASFGDMFSLDEAKIPKSQTTKLAQDETIGNLPVSFADDKYKDVPFALTIGNTSAETIDFHDARVITLYIGQDAEGNSPDVVLPGGVTFGTSKTNVFEMYGNLSAVDDDTYEGTLADSVYALELSNKRNKIYFGFKNDQLVEIQWYYIDMTNYRDL